MRTAAALLVCGSLCSSVRALELKPETLQAFDRYIAQTETRLDQSLQPGGTFLWTDEASGRAAKVRRGDLVVENRSGRDTIPVTGGLIHDWVGAVFVPGATLKTTLALMQDYDHHVDYYKPAVLASRLTGRDGNDFKVHLRLMKKKVITVILDTDYDVRYFPMDTKRARSRAYSTRIAEVEDAGNPAEHTMPPGDDNGFLWRLYSYWRFQERDGGVYVECQAVSLTRGIPAGLNWLVQPIITSLPRESLANTLRDTRTALAK